MKSPHPSLLRAFFPNWDVSDTATLLFKLSGFVFVVWSFAWTWTMTGVWVVLAWPLFMVAFALVWPALMGISIAVAAALHTGWTVLRWVFKPRT